MVTFLPACASRKDHLERTLQHFFSSSLQLNSSIILPFSELVEKEPRHHLVQNCLHSTFALDQLPIHFLRVSSTSVSVFFLITYQIHLDETKLMTLFHIFGTFLMNFGSWFNKLPGEKCIYLINAGPRINAGSTRLIFK